VANKTNNKIEEIIDQLDPLDKMVLLNAVYFNGIWSKQFDEDGTKLKMFHQSSNNSYEVPMMNKLNELEYFSNSFISSVKMPYGNGQYNMLILLPRSGYNSQHIIDEFSASNWKSWMEEYEMKEQVVVTMPRFKYAFELEMKDVLKQMGMEKAFNPSHSDFSKIADVNDLYINSVVHKSFVDVNENGTEAAAVTSVTFGVTSVQPGEDQKIYFTVDKPFVFAITEKDTGAILFLGEVNRPEYD
jgi:serpin B